MEFQSGAWPGAAPTGIATCDRSALLPESVGQGSLVTEDPREVGSLSGGAMSPDGSAPIRPVSGRHSLPPSSFTRRPVGSSCESLSFVGETTGLPRSVDVPRWGGSSLFAGGASSAPGEFRVPGPDHVPFWLERISIFRSLIFTAFIAASPGLTRPPDPGPDRIDAGSRGIGSRRSRPPKGGGYVVPGAWHVFVTEGALPRGILLAEQQVLSASPRSQHSHIDDFVSHRHKYRQLSDSPSGLLVRSVRLSPGRRRAAVEVSA
jgi:hypothetical protein